LADEKVDIVAFMRFIFLRDFVSAHKSRDDIDKVKTVRLSQRFELLDFILEVQPVTALALSSGGSMEKHPVETGKTEGEKIVLGSLPCSVDSCLNPHPFFSELLICIALKAENKLLLSGSGKREVSVRVDKSWKPD